MIDFQYNILVRRLEIALCRNAHNRKDYSGGSYIPLVWSAIDARLGGEIMVWGRLMELLIEIDEEEDGCGIEQVNATNLNCRQPLTLP